MLIPHTQGYSVHTHCGIETECVTHSTLRMLYCTALHGTALHYSAARLVGPDFSFTHYLHDYDVLCCGIANMGHTLLSS